MSKRSALAARTLSRFGELEWYGLSAESNPVHGYLQVPLMKWRFKARSERTAQLIRESVRASSTQVEWTLDTSRRNWVLLPSRVSNEARGLANPAFSKALELIITQDQEFCRRALADFERIISDLREVSIPEI
ncbi:hypothetical protein ACFSUJ_12730 [Streptomyces lusitanus]|uniref:Uncharacterized protein n=1 Tax=Streptomyces lusitanus TaxID=68232 RepID=A0ABU3JPF3_9ACTN|nr:hypothetical protein [Streptomyces lusitanus]